MLVRTLLGIDLLVALVVVYFLAAGLADGSVSSFNMSLWLGLLAAVAAAVGGGGGSMPMAGAVRRLPCCRS